MRHIDVEAIITELSTCHFGISLSKSFIAYRDPLKSRSIEIFQKSYKKKKYTRNATKKVIKYCKISLKLDLEKINKKDKNR